LKSRTLKKFFSILDLCAFKTKDEKRNNYSTICNRWVQGVAFIQPGIFK